MPKVNREKLKEAINCLGGMTLLAEKINVSYTAVRDWNKGRSGITIKNALEIEKATDGKIKGKDLIIDPWEEQQ